VLCNDYFIETYKNCYLERAYSYLNIVIPVQAHGRSLEPIPRLKRPSWRAAGVATQSGASIIAALDCFARRSQ
jgi:hypothetical protein